MSSQDELTVEQLANAVSVQAKTATRTWLVTITVSVAALLPPVPSSTSHLVQLPMGFPVAQTALYPLLFAVLSVSSIALASAHSQHMRAYRLAHQYLTHLLSHRCDTSGAINPRDLFDALTVSGLTRVAPVAQLLRGKHQYAGTRAGAPFWKRAISTVYYVILKVVVFAVLFALPGIALWQTYARLTTVWSGWRLLPASIIGVIAAVSLLTVTCADLINVCHIARVLSEGDAPLPETTDRNVAGAGSQLQER